MTQVLRSPSDLPSSPRPSLSCDPNDNSATHLRGDPFGGEEEDDPVGVVEGKRRGEEGEEVERGRRKELQVPPLLALLLTALRRSLLGCKTEGEERGGGGGGEEELRSMEIGFPTDVRHVAHVTFDRFHGFLGLPVEFEPEVPSRAPSASASVFGVSTESMQCSYDSRGNSVPTILLLMQRRLYEQGGLRAEGIFRINADNCQQEYVRDQLNSGIVPDGVDVHCLAGLIKAWFRELPTGVLDSLSPEQVMQCQSEEDCAQLAGLLPPTEAALLDWAINLMADVVQEEQQNKMNARNVAMVFAPNMTQMADPLTALMYAVQVMNFLKMLILKTLKERQGGPILESTSNPHRDSRDENGDSSPHFHLGTGGQEATERISDAEEPNLDSPTHLSEGNVTTDDVADSSRTFHAKGIRRRAARHSTGELFFEIPTPTDRSANGPQSSANGSNAIHVNSRRIKIGRTGSMSHCKGARKTRGQSTARKALSAEKSKGISVVSCIDLKAERVEAWR